MATKQSGDPFKTTGTEQSHLPVAIMVTGSVLITDTTCCAAKGLCGGIAEAMSHLADGKALVWVPRFAEYRWCSAAHQGVSRGEDNAKPMPRTRRIYVPIPRTQLQPAEDEQIPGWLLRQG